MPAPTLQPLASAPDLVERVHQALVAAIADGSLGPGQRLTQEELAQRLGVSRQPVLQALRLLKVDGLVLDAPGRGVQVAPLEARGMAQVYEVRGALDAMAARLAARRVADARRAGRVPPAGIDPALIAAGRQAAAGPRVAAMIDADWAFHQAVYAAGDNPLIERSAGQHWCHIRRAMGATLQASAARAAVWDEHAAIARAIAEGDEERAAALALRHAESAGRHIGERLARPQASAA